MESGGEVRTRGGPLLPHDKADGELRYVWFSDGQLVLIDPRSCASHCDAANYARGYGPGLKPPPGVLSAGRVVIDRKARTVRMGDRDSHSLRLKSRPGDADAVAIRAVLFGGGA